MVTEVQVRLTAADAAAALLRRDGDTLDTRGRVPVQIGHGSRDALEQGWYTLSQTAPPQDTSRPVTLARAGMSVFECGNVY